MSETIPGLKYERWLTDNDVKLATIITGTTNILSHTINNHFIKFQTLLEIAIYATMNNNMEILKRVVSNDYPVYYSSSIADEISDHIITSKINTNDDIAEFLVVSLDTRDLTDGRWVTLMSRIVEYKSIKCHRFVFEKAGGKGYAMSMIKMFSNIDTCLKLLEEIDVENKELKSMLHTYEIFNNLGKSITIYNALRHKLSLSQKK
jgi:hypothetical protein